MCTSIANGGRRCKKHEAQAAKNKLKKAKESGNAEDVKAATVEYLQTEEGIEQLEESGKDELAEKFRVMRNRKIELHNAHWGTHHRTMAPRRIRRAAAYDLRGFDKKSKLNKETGTLYDPKGWDIAGNHKDTHTPFTPDGFNVSGIDADGYGRDGYKNGYGRDGYNQRGWDREGYLATGFHHRTMLDRDGYDAEGWARSGIHASTGKPYDAQGYDRWGYHTITGINKDTGMTHSEELSDQFGYKPQSPVSA